MVEIMSRSWSQLPDDRPKMQEDHSSTSLNTSSQHLSSNSSHVDAQDESEQEHGISGLTVPCDDTVTKDLTQAPNEDHCDERTALLSDSNSKSRYLTRKRKCICCAIIAASILVIASAGFAVYFRFITTSTHPACPMLNPPANGSVFCGNTKCWFSCPNNYRLMINKTQPTSNWSTCFSNNSTWSNSVPYCEKMTFCGQIAIPGIDERSYCVSNKKTVPINGGSTSIGYPNGTTCHIACSSSYILHGAKIVSCNTSSWQPILPVCQIKECPPFNLTAFVEKSCTKGRRVSSICSFKCADGKHLVGMSSITCQPSLKWSDVPPTCSASCPKCLTGPHCKESTSWAKLVLFIKKIRAWRTASARYAGYSITCHVNKHGGVFSFTWDCTCTDILSSLDGRCKDYKSPSGSCEHALGELVRKMVARGTYPEPCDEKSMTVGCKK